MNSSTIFEKWFAGQHDEFFLYANSKDVVDHPTNTANDFVVVLPHSLKLNEGSWKVALCDISWISTKTIRRDLMRIHVECDIVQPLICNKYHRRILSSIPVLASTAKRVFYEPTLKRYVYINSNTIAETLHILLVDDDGEKVQNLGKNVSLTLHFKRVFN